MNRKFILLLAAAAAILVYWQIFSAPVIVNREPLGENIICFGDSLTYGTGASEDHSYPAHLSRLIGLPVINQGHPGDTTADGLLRLEKDVLNNYPRIVLITLGGNDLRKRLGKTEAFANLEKIIRAIQAKGALVIVGEIRIPFISRDFSSQYQVVCRKTGAVFVPDILGGIMGNASLMSDRIHPNGKGYEVMAGKFRKAIDPYIF